jgi:hypothetical protein
MKEKLIKAIQDLKQSDMRHQIALSNKNTLARTLAKEFEIEFTSYEQVRGGLTEQLSDILLEENLK